MPPSSDPSSADADADDDPSAPSPASSARKYSIPVVYSSEVLSDDVMLLPLAKSELTKGSVDELAPLLCDFHVGILPVLGPPSALFCMHIVTYVWCELAGRPIERPLPVHHRDKLYEWVWKDLLHRESCIVGKQFKYARISPPFRARAPPANPSLIL
jgi:hypothetical protein